MNSLIDLIADAGLCGRGGAAFPTAVKLRSAADHDAALIVNACDGEWGAQKDGWVIAHHLEEVAHAAQRIAGDRFCVAAHRDSQTLHLVRAAGLSALEVPRRYVSSEESALAALAAGDLARPAMRFAPITSGARTGSGVNIPPTLVLNAETLWRIEQIVRRGAQWFRSMGTVTEPGPRLVTLRGAVARPGVYESAAGTHMSQLIGLAGGFSARSDYLWLNGIAGGFLSTGVVSRTSWSAEGLTPYQLRIGSAIIAAIDSRTDPWDIVSDTVAYAAGESAQQCGPCVFGLPTAAEELERLLRGTSTTRERQLFRRRLGLLHGRGACRHPDGVAAFIESALTTFHHRLPGQTPTDTPRSPMHVARGAVV